MKKSLFFALLLAGAAFSASAQTEQGNFLVGGNLQLNTAKNNTQITVSPNAGYFFADNFAGGVNLNFGYSKVGQSSVTNSYKTTRFDIGPFARYYVGTTNLRPFLHANVDFTSSKTKVTTQTSTSNGVGYFFGPGVAAFLNRNVALEGLIGYDHFAYKNQEGSGGLALKVGFQIYLNHAEVKAATTVL